MNDLILMPCYNEAKTLPRVVAEVLRWRGEADVLVLDDGSQDQSLQLLAGFPVALLRHCNNEGYGQTLIDGFAYAAAHHYQACVTLDCDEQHEPHLIPRFLAELSDCDVVSGSRYLEPSEGVPPPDRYQINQEITELLRSLTRLSLTDSFCGFKAYRLAALNRLQLDEPGYAFPVQFWMQAARAGLRVKEIPISLIYKSFDRRFPGPLNTPEIRRRYYLRIIEEEAKKWQKS
ncbi:MAG: glycosyltransferase family 2 protein [Coprothermobacterota bacterium]|nr:glycosyltransferase family 2 protein [Coprothermobacterota bacterium]